MKYILQIEYDDIKQLWLWQRHWVGYFYEKFKTWLHCFCLLHCSCFGIVLFSIWRTPERPKRATLLCGYSFSVHSRAATVLFTYSLHVNSKYSKVVFGSKRCGVYLYVILIWPLRIDQKCFLRSPSPNERWSSSSIIYLIYIRNAMCG